MSRAGAFGLLLITIFASHFVRYRLSIASSRASRFEPRPEAKTPIGTIQLGLFGSTHLLHQQLRRVDPAELWNPFRSVSECPVFFLRLVQPTDSFRRILSLCEKLF